LSDGFLGSRSQHLGLEQGEEATYQFCNCSNAIPHPAATAAHSETKNPLGALISLPSMYKKQSFRVPFASGESVGSPVIAGGV
jgi:hypothetical protein